MGEAEVEVRAQGEWLQGRQGRSRGVRMRGSYLQLRMRGSYIKLALGPDSAAAQRRSIFTLTPPPPTGRSCPGPSPLDLPVPARAVQ